MKDEIIRLLSTRLLEEALINKALKQNIKIDCLSFIETKKITDNVVSEKVAALALRPTNAVFTSINGAEAVIDDLRKYNLQPAWKIYCIGAATQSLIRKYFILSRIAGTGKNAIELSATIINNNEKDVVFFCGNERRDELPERLRKTNIEVKEIVVYETNEISAKIEKEYKGILFFSPSAVKSFFSVNSISTDTVLFSIGDTTANEIKKNSNNKIIVSNFPLKEKVVEIAIKYFNSK